MAAPDGNLLAQLPTLFDAEVFETICRSEHVRIERIVSRGHTSPSSGWYDQEEQEWVVVLQGAATLRFDDGSEVHLGHGDHLNIPAHRKHKVSWTATDRVTIWLAVFFR